jgi:hypothetical protein
MSSYWKLPTIHHAHRATSLRGRDSCDILLPSNNAYGSSFGLSSSTTLYIQFSSRAISTWPKYLDSWSPSLWR